MASENILKNLNAEQKKAVVHKEGPLLIIAGAGTGKTTVIAHRIAHLIVDKKIAPDQILALTFTDKAAFQMQEKVDILVPYGFNDVWISTFHAFGDRILRENALEFGLSPDFAVLTRPQAAVFFRENLFKFSLEYYRPLGLPTKFVDALLNLFSRLRDEDIPPEEYLQYTEGLRQKAKENPGDKALDEEANRQHEIARCYRSYLEFLLKEGKVDFANQFFLTLQLLREHPSILKRYQTQFRYILIDEFQDTNYAQFELIKLLAGGHRNLTVVADDDQSIYKWRGAAVSNILQFMEIYPESEKVTLTKNYRSTQAILDCAYRMIQNNNPDRFEVQAKINKRLVGKSKAGKKPVHKHFDSISSECDWVAGYIETRVKKKKADYQDFAILVRSNSDAEPFLRSLNMRAIPWQFSGNQGLYSREEIRLCIAFLRLIVNPADSLSLYFLASSLLYQFPAVELLRVMNFAQRRHWDLFYVFKKLGEMEEFADISPEFLSLKEKFIKDIESYIESTRTSSTGKLLYLFLTQSGFLKYLVEQESLESENKVKNLAKFFDIVKDFEYSVKEDRVIHFINYLDMLISVGDDPPVAEADLDAEAVHVMTIHKAKGLEFPFVFMVSLVEQRFPWPARREPLELPEKLIKDILPMGDFHIQEERRLFYVGMTRAQKELFLTSAVDYGTKRSKKVSRFVRECLSTQKEDKVIKKSALEAIERHAPRAGMPAQSAQKVFEDDKILTLSYFQIDDYLTCPLKYKYVHILRVPIMAHHTVLYGKALHDAVQYYHQQKIKGAATTEEEIVKIFENSFRKEGFLSREHVEMRVQTAHKGLRQFFKEQESSQKIPSLIEKDFSFMLGNNRIIGRWDRIDMHNEEVTVIDFKSSQIETQQEADQRTKESLQLNLYSLAYEKTFGRLPDYKELHFLDTGLIGRSVVSEKHTEKAKEAVTKASAGIRSGNFAAMPARMACLYCAYNQICPSADVS